MISRIHVNNADHDLIGSLVYCTSSTGQDIVAKTANLQSVNSSEFTLYIGLRISVNFSNANRASNPTLNVAGTGAKKITWHGTAIPAEQWWVAKSVVDFVYDGANWEMVGVNKDNNTWQLKTKTAPGYVTAGGSNYEKAWMTDRSGNPGWRAVGNVTCPGGAALSIVDIAVDSDTNDPPQYTIEFTPEEDVLSASTIPYDATNGSVSGAGSVQDAIDMTASKLSTYLPLSGGTVTGNITMDNSASSQSGEPYIQWATVSNNKPYTGFAHDQSDGTFIICSMEKDTTTNGVKYYRNGLAIGGGSGNLFWKGSKIATAEDLANKANSSHNQSASTITSGTLAIARGGTGYNSFVDTTYTTARYRASALLSSEPSTLQNGVIYWIYE